MVMVKGMGRGGVSQPLTVTPITIIPPEWPRGALSGNLNKGLFDKSRIPSSKGVNRTLRF